MFTWAEFNAFLQVIWIDLALAGDNAIVVGMAAAGLPRELRNKAIIFGIVGAVVVRVGFALITTQLLQVIGLLLAGGLLLLWVSWKLWREIVHERRRRQAEALSAAEEATGESPAVPATEAKPKSFREAVVQIVIADISMSLDNVLAVAGAAREHEWVLIFGLALSVALMAVAANMIARLLKRHHWIAYIGLAVILYVAVKMCYDGGMEIWHAVEEQPATTAAPAPGPTP
ncbi:MAG TPA: TerC family protein [Kiloniellales bacterium]|nr:TerC family protein [Kiloniellales bacterium]